MNEKNNEKNLIIPISIIIAGLLIALSIFFAFNKDTDNSKESQNKDSQAQTEETKEAEEIKETKETEKTETGLSPESITKEDHIFGNPDAEIFVVTYTDAECPYCKKFHETMLDIIKNEDYIKEGSVAWVVRHSPIPQLHPLALQKSAALECAGLLGGNDVFWKYINKIFEEIPLKGSLELSRFSEIASEQGLNKTKFEACMKKDSTKETIQEDLDSAANVGVKGTPYNIIVSKDGNIPIPGAQPYKNIDSKIREALNSN